MRKNICLVFNERKPISTTNKSQFCNVLHKVQSCQNNCARINEARLKVFSYKFGFSYAARNVVIYANAHSYNQFIRDYIYLNDFIALSCHKIFP